MAEKRMFSKTIIDSDAFLDMPLSTQALYFHLSMRADDEGFINNPKKIQRIVGASDDDMRILAVKNFIIPFESGVVVIKHWKIHNYIRRERLKPTVYQEEAAQLCSKKNGAYTFRNNEMSDKCLPSDGQASDKCLPTDGEMSAQYRVDKISLDLDKISLDLPFTNVNGLSDASDQEIIKAVDHWNETNFKSVHRLDRKGKRYQNLSARIKQYGLDEVLKAIDIANSSQFLLGDNKRGWVMSFDWFVLPNNFIKVLDGNYTKYATEEDDLF